MASEAASQEDQQGDEGPSAPGSPTWSHDPADAPSSPAYNPNNPYYGPAAFVYSPAVPSSPTYPPISPYYSPTSVDSPFDRPAMDRTPTPPPWLIEHPTLRSRKLHLLKLPNSWLMQLVSQHLPSTDLLCLMQTSRQSRDMVLSHAPYLATLRLDVMDASMARLLDNLHWARSCKQLSLVVASEGCASGLAHFGGHLEGSRVRAVCAGVWNILLKELTLSPFHQLTSLIIQTMDLESPLGSAACRAFPHLRKMALQQCTFVWEEDSMPGLCTAQHYSLLQVLELNALSCQQVLTSARCVALIQQIGTLPALNTIVLDTGWSIGNSWDYWVSTMLLGIMALGRQLTRLVLKGHGAAAFLLNAVLDLPKEALNMALVEAPPHLPLPKPLPGPQHAVSIQLVTQLAVTVPLSGVQQLHLPDAVLGTAEMAMLLQLPALRHVIVHAVDLQHGGFQHNWACVWEELTMCSMTVYALAHLPLNNPNLQLVLKPAEGYAHQPELCFGGFNVPMDVAELAAANLAQCKGLFWDMPEMAFTVGDAFPAEGLSSVLACLLPVLGKHTNNLQLVHFRMTDDLVTQLFEWMDRSTVVGQLCKLKLSHCQWAVPDLISLVLNMPEEGAMLHLDWHAGDAHVHTEQELTHLCCAAIHKVWIGISSQAWWHGFGQLPQDCIPRIQAAMAACGHQNAKLTVE